MYLQLRTEVLDKIHNCKSAMFMERVRYWFNQVGREFYKFNAACEHPEYKLGDSWQEELRMSRHEFDYARKTCATRIMSGESKSQLTKTHNENGSLAPINHIILYWRDTNNRLWYWFNQELYNEHFPETEQSYVMSKNQHSYVMPKNQQPYVMPKNQQYINQTKQQTKQQTKHDDEIQEIPLLDNSIFLKEQGVQGKILDDLKTRPLPELVEAFELARKKSSDNPVGYAITMLQQGIFEKSVPEVSKSKNQFDGIDFSDFTNNDVPADKPPQKKKYPWENSDSIAKNSDSSPSDKSLNQIIAENYTAQKIWDITSNQLEHQLGRANFDTWLRPARLRKVKKDGTFVVKVHNESARNMLQHRLYKNVHRALSMVTGNSDIKIQFITEQILTPASIPVWQNQVTDNLMRA